MPNLKLFSSCSKCLLVIIHVFIIMYSDVVEIEGFDSMLQLPKSRETRIRNRTRPKLSRVLHIGEFGAIGDGSSDDTQVFENVWKAACSSKAKTTILVPANYTSLIHSIDFGGPCKTKVTLLISGTIVAPNDPSAWAGLNRRRWLYFHGVNHLTIKGGGVINGMGQKWWDMSCKVNKTYPCRHAPTAMTFHKCKYLSIENLKVINSQQMHMAFTSCLRVNASNLQVVAPTSSPNTDGIHISASRGVVVRDSRIQTGDDCISIVNNSSRIRIRNISCGPGHGISIGSLGKANSWAQVHDVLVDEAFLFNTDNGVRIKTWQGGSGFASNIRFQNIGMRNVSNPIIIDQYYCDSFLPCDNKTSAVKVEDIFFEHIRGTSATEEAIRFACSSEFPCERIHLHDILLMLPDGGFTDSYCCNAYGSISGSIYPPSCLEYNESFIEQKGSSNSGHPSF